MCGFVGAWTLRPPFDPPELPSGRLDRLRHRGPDGAGWHTDERSRLGFRRLAIIDVATGMQPLPNEDGRVVAMVNGEIYNHKELRPELIRDHVFRTNSDAEVVLHGYEEWGDNVFRMLRGMFAVAVADRRRDRLVLARDRVGKKPLYYRLDDRVLRFASEIGPLLDAGPRSVDRAALNDYLRFGYVPAPRTLFEGIRKLPAGCLLTAEGEANPEVRRWAEPLVRSPAARGDDAEWACAVRHALADAVAVRLESEVPLGFLLSGGVDSAGVFALGAQTLGAPARAFTIGFDDAEVDETAAAASVAERYAARHAVRVMRRGEAPGLGDVIARCEEPIATDALLPTDRVFAAVRDAGITTVLAGEGSDEIFAGYQKFSGAAAAATGRRSDWADGGPTPLSRYLATEEFCFPTLGERRALIGAAATDDGYEEIQAAVEHLDPLSQMLALEVALRLPDRINHRLDRLSMAHSIEARAPFMDDRLMELALQVPHAIRVRDGVPKAILRRALADDLPGAIAAAKKAPFRAPDTWFVEGKAGLDPREAEHAGLVDPTVVKRLRARARTGDRSARERLYNLTVLHLWHRRAFCTGGLTDAEAIP